VSRDLLLKFWDPPYLGNFLATDFQCGMYIVQNGLNEKSAKLGQRGREGSCDLLF